MLFALLLTLLPLSSAIMAASETPTRRHLNITAISAKNGISTIECWVLNAPSVIASEAGIAGAAFTQLGKAGNLSYAVIPPRFDDGFHNAPVAQYVAFTSGEAVISVPGSDEKAFIKGGKYGLIFAADTASVSKNGHATQYPSDQETTAFQIPTADGEIPPHTVLHPGPCRQLRFEPQNE